ncbi:hypothetical protein [Haliangium ochraceum]|uniref:Contractile injection system tube protein N-terminal domain-containing protein n=1 Tax=Haliangium ochraceum (strain DSM 14365 / JCM 11303 / SMP-2) TaxID=502025 RepID=D0LHL2_HALO1|nr:hypothetical protein [Haliangium ochraceum]ACY12874.1 hypothetical protein Hoch_0233 [Haliangium ochraceum DSM 14365]
MASEQLQKCTIVSLEESDIKIEALYNPNKIKISKKVNWSAHSPTPDKKQQLEYAASAKMQTRTLSMELFFDGSEQGKNVHALYVSVLQQFTVPEKYSTKTSKNKEEKVLRPPFVMVVWGTFPPFKGVLDSVDADYSLFTPGGMPLRATCSLSFTEVDPLQLTGAQKSA